MHAIAIRWLVFSLDSRYLSGTEGKKGFSELERLKKNPTSNHHKTDKDIR